MIFDGERSGSLSRSCIYMCHENVIVEILVSSYSKTGAIAMAFDHLRSLGDFLEASRVPPSFIKYNTHGYTWATHGLHMGYTWLHMCYMCKMGFLYVLHMYELVFFGFTHGYTWLHVATRGYTPPTFSEITSCMACDFPVLGRMGAWMFDTSYRYMFEIKRSTHIKNQLLLHVLFSTKFLLWLYVTCLWNLSCGPMGRKQWLQAW